MRGRPQLVVEFVDERHAGRNFDLRNLVVGNVVEIFDQGAETVAVGSDEDALALSDLRRDLADEIGLDPRDRVLEALGERDGFRRQHGIAAVCARPAFVVRLERGRRHVEAAAPDEDLLLRSEEHTSELQSLMRSSYAVFCLKKKNDIEDQSHTY